MTCWLLGQWEAEELIVEYGRPRSNFWRVYQRSVLSNKAYGLLEPVRVLPNIDVTNWNIPPRMGRSRE